MNVPLPESRWLLLIPAVTVTAGIFFWRVVRPLWADLVAGRLESDDEGDDDD